MHEREIIWELFDQVILETWQGCQGEFSIEHKPLIEMSLARCWEEQLIPTNQTGKPRFQGEFPLPRFLPFLGRSRPGTGSANNQPLWPETLPEPAWAGGEKIHELCSFQLLQALPVRCFFTFPSGFMHLEQMWCPGALCSTGPAVSAERDLFCCTQIPALGQEVQRQTRAVGAASERGAVKGNFIGVYSLPSEWKQLTVAGLKSELDDVRKTGIFTPECLRQLFQKSVLQGQ